MTLVPSGLQRRPHSFRRDSAYLAALEADFKLTGTPRGIFFDTSGNARVEIINKSAQYTYIWRSDANKTEGVRNAAVS